MQNVPGIINNHKSQDEKQKPLSKEVGTSGELPLVNVSRHSINNPGTDPRVMIKFDEKKVIEHISTIFERKTPVKNGKTSLKSPVNNDYYEWLGLDVHATEPQIKKAYHTLALKHHPDKKNANPDLNIADDKFIKINEAYEILSSKKYRFIYDTFGFKKSDFGIVYGGLGKFVGDYLGVTHIEPLIGKVRLYYKIMDVVESIILKSSSERDYDEKKDIKFDDKTLSDVIYDVLKKHTSEQYDKFLEAPIERLEERLKMYTDHFHDGTELSPVHSNSECFDYVHQNAEQRLRKVVRDEIEATSGKISPLILKTIGRIYLIEADSWLSSLSDSQNFIVRNFCSIKGSINNTFKTTSLKFSLMAKIVFSTLSLISKLCTLPRSKEDSASPKTPDGTNLASPSSPNPITSSTARANNVKEAFSSQLSRNSKSDDRLLNAANEKNDEIKKESFKYVIERLILLMSHACNLEALTTAKKMCDSVLKDKSQPLELKRLKCTALKIISEEYSAIKAPALTIDIEF